MFKVLPRSLARRRRAGVDVILVGFEMLHDDLQIIMSFILTGVDVVGRTRGMGCEAVRCMNPSRLVSDRATG